MPPPSTSSQPKLPNRPQLTPRLISSSNRAQSPLLSPHPNHTAIPFTNIGGPSPPPSAPASYSSGAGSVPRQLKGYNGFEEHPYSYPQYAGSPNSAAGALAAGLPGVARHASSNGQTAYEFATVDDAKGIEENVVFVGFEGGMEVWKVGRSAVEMVGRLEGMRGGVKGGKVCLTLFRCSHHCRAWW